MKNKKYIFSILLFLFLLFGTYYFILKDYSINDFISSVKGCNPIFILLAFCCLFLYVFFASFYLKRTFTYFGKEISWYQAFGYHFTEVYFSAITPSSLGGQPVQMVEMNKDNIPYRINSVVILLNSLLYKVALIFLAIFVAIFYSQEIFSQSPLFYWLVSLGFITTILVILLFASLIYSKKFIPKIASFLFLVGEKIHLIKNRKELEEKIFMAMKDYAACAEFTKKHPRVLIEGIFILLGQRLALLSISFMIYLAFGLHSFHFFEIIAFQICITLASDFMPFPGGVVVSEGLLLQINQMIYGSLLATSSMILLRGISFYFIVIFSGFFYLWFHFKKRRKAVDL